MTNKPTTENFILGIKLGTAQIFDEQGKVVPVTVIQAGPCKVVQVKTKEKDGYEAVQVGFLRKRKLNHPLSHHIKTHLGKVIPFRYLREFRLDEPYSAKEGHEITASIFQKGDKLKVTGITKAKGFQGTVKRHNFKGASSTHGTKHAHRQPGSIGSTDAARVFKGKKMAGRMGRETKTIKNLKVVEVNAEKNLLLVKGSVPGNTKGLLKIVKIN